MEATKWLSEGVEVEFSGAELGDPRRNSRLGMVVSQLETEPSASFPELFQSSAELEGFYRFLRNEAVDPKLLLAPHIEASCRRAESLGECLVVHDTTEFAFAGKREGLGRTSSKGEGFFAHTSLLVATDEARTPLGVGAIEQYARKGPKGSRRMRDRIHDETSEGRRWLRGAEAVEASCAGRFSCIHVADREGDSFPFLSGLAEAGHRFVVRVSHDRRVLDEDDEFTRLHEVLFDLTPQASYQIHLSSRGKGLNPKQRRLHPVRREREATVSIAATRVTVPVPSHRPRAPHFEVNLVRVWEQEPPDGEAPVQWILWTTEPVETAADMKRVVDFYRARWVIEEYFKALKTGCRIEKRQLESFNTLTTALTLFLPVAWKLLLARSLARKHPTCPPTAILSPLQVTYLEKHFGKAVTNVREAFLAIARLGGHLKQNGDPGWLTLARGYEKLATGEAFYLVMQRETCDQS